jgi:hypothetical protein
MPSMHAPGILICAVVGENAIRVKSLCVRVCVPLYFCRLYHSPLRDVGPDWPTVVEVPALLHILYDLPVVTDRHFASLIRD